MLKLKLKSTSLPRGAPVRVLDGGQLEGSAPGGEAMPRTVAGEELRLLAEALRRDALLQVDSLVNEHTKRLQCWADGSFNTALTVAPPELRRTEQCSPPPPMQRHTSDDLSAGDAKPASVALPPSPALLVSAAIQPQEVPEKCLVVKHEVSLPGCAVDAPAEEVSPRSEDGPRKAAEELSTMAPAPPLLEVPDQRATSKASSFVSSTKSHATKEQQDMMRASPTDRSSTRDRRASNKTTTSDIRLWVQEQEQLHGEPAVGNDDMCAKKVVKSSAFDKTMGFLLILNALVIGIKVDWLARERTTEVPSEFMVIDWCFVSCFIMELLIRLAAGPTEFFRGKDWKWNVFDGFVVLIQVADEVMQLLVKGAGDSSAAQEAMDSVSFVRIFRLARLVRFVRMVRLLSGLKSMVYLLLASMSSFGWAALMLLFLMFCMAVYFTEMSTVGVKDADPETVDILIKYWGSLPRSMLTLFKALFGGFDWEVGLDVFEGIDSDAYIMNTLVMSSYISFTTLVMLNLVTGVFVEGAQRIVKEDRDKELLHLAAHIFDFADKNGNQELEEEEFVEILQSDIMASFCDVNKIETDEVHMLFQLLMDADSDSVPIGEFVHACKLLQGDARSADVQAVKLMCKQYFEESDDRMARIEGLLTAGLVRPEACQTSQTSQQTSPQSRPADDKSLGSARPHSTANIHIGDVSTTGRRPSIQANRSTDFSRIGRPPSFGGLDVPTGSRPVGPRRMSVSSSTSLRERASIRTPPMNLS